MTSMHTDAAVLASEAGHFDRIAGELHGHQVAVDGIAAQLQASLKGDAGSAAQLALVRFNEAMAQQLKELSDISNNIQTAGTQYTSADGDAASNLANQMHI
ncbi:type VII secretion protein EsxB [Mycobacterium sp. CBMA 234]|uniref:WXG100 family type VII secretion target n=1 Tax=Mycolicibacterium sp. CBMA 234 TaxID=1918495 RepID=UPI0012DD484B|nr:WXG100 family type VII secretion target [Mycolicibacterium sp. CBMA 234]MUL67335.1 type VII secretion protein EsxB [Mycolicibacterium sp. CBMA 234]